MTNVTSINRNPSIRAIRRLRRKANAALQEAILDNNFDDAQEAHEDSVSLTERLEEVRTQLKAAA